MSGILVFKDVCYFYNQSNKKIEILKNANYTFEKGKMYTLLGPSGCGKTTTLALASALESPVNGEILYEGRRISEIGMSRYRSDKIGIVFQSFNLINYMSAMQNVQMVMEITRNKINNKKQTALDLLKKVGLSEDEAHRNIMKLSGGQQQRVAIARAIASDAGLIFADEPTGNLDADTALEIVEIFYKLAHNDGKCIIAVTHSNVLAGKADVIVKLKNGQIVDASK
jgi:ABC-type antimicrobial peptide transport system, ATPase component